MTSEARPRRSATIAVLDALTAAFRGLRHARAAGAGAAIAAAATIALVFLILRAPYDLAPVGVGPAAPPEALVVAGTEPSTTRPTTPPPSPTATPTPTATAPPTTLAPTRTSAPPQSTPAALTGRYTQEDSGLWGYRSSVTIRNPGSVAVKGWTMVITLPRESLAVGNVSGATARKSGSTWTFTPTDGTRSVPRSGAVTVRFEVNGAPLLAAPTACTVDGHACTGLTEN